MKTKSKAWRMAPMVAALVAIAAACSPTVMNHGYQINPDDLSQVQPGVTSREEVQKILGTPSMVGTFDGERWLYVSQRTEQVAFYRDKTVAQDVVQIDFDQAGIVKDVNQHGLEMAQAITPDPDKTHTLGNELTVLQQFFSNLGRFNTDPNATARAASAARSPMPGAGGGF